MAVTMALLLLLPAAAAGENEADDERDINEHDDDVMRMMTGVCSTNGMRMLLLVCVCVRGLSQDPAEQDPRECEAATAHRDDVSGQILQANQTTGPTRYVHPIPTIAATAEATACILPLLLLLTLLLLLQLLPLLATIVSSTP